MLLVGTYILEEENVCVVWHQLRFSILFNVFDIILFHWSNQWSVVVVSYFGAYNYKYISARREVLIIRFCCYYVWCRQKAKENIFRIKLNNYLQLNHCNTSCANDFMNWQSYMICGVRFPAINVIPIWFDVILKQLSFFVTTL